MDSTKRIERQLTEAQFERLLRPTLRLFLSADIVGSTRLKQQAAAKAGSSAGDRWWLPDVASFFYSFPDELQHATLSHGATKFDPPGVWKLLGDEIVFSTVIEESTSVTAYMRAFVDVLHDWNRGKRGRPAPFRVKGTAWIAGFPVANTVVPLVDGSYDYLGASIDIGFRLANFSSTRFMAISVELAWMLATIGSTAPSLAYRGRRALDGIGIESGYPLFCVDTGPSKLEELEDQIEGPRTVDLPAIARFCEEFISEHGRPHHLPFIPDDPNPAFAREPRNYARDRTSVETILRKDVFEVETPEKPRQDAPGEAESISADEIDREITALEKDANRRKPPGE